jgi:crossover junction endodeoxyribonuclease RuvC
VVILGIDPGLQKTGWGVIRSSGSRHEFLGAGTIKSNSRVATEERLLALAQGLGKVIDEFQIEEAAIEETFVNRNAKSSLMLGHARGALMLAIAQKGISIKPYAATLVKKSISGTGRAEKHQISAMLKIILGVEINEPDAADALAVAICHSHHGFVSSLS